MSLWEFGSAIHLLPHESDGAIVQLAPTPTVTALIPAAKRKGKAYAGGTHQVTVDAPPLAWSYAFDPETGKPHGVHLWALSGDQSQLAPYLLSNAYADGGICWGENRIPRTLKEAHNLYWSAPHNWDLWEPFRQHDRGTGHECERFADGHTCDIEHECSGSEDHSHECGNLRRYLDGRGERCEREHDYPTSTAEGEAFALDVRDGLHHIEDTDERATIYREVGMDSEDCLCLCCDGSCRCATNCACCNEDLSLGDDRCSCLYCECDNGDCDCRVDCACCRGDCDCDCETECGCDLGERFLTHLRTYQPATPGASGFPDTELQRKREAWRPLAPVLVGETSWRLDGHADAVLVTTDAETIAALGGKPLTVTVREKKYRMGIKPGFTVMCYMDDQGRYWRTPWQDNYETNGERKGMLFDLLPARDVPVLVAGLTRNLDGTYSPIGSDLKLTKEGKPCLASTT